MLVQQNGWNINTTRLNRLQVIRLLQNQESIMIFQYKNGLAEKLFGQILFSETFSINRKIIILSE